MGKAGVVCGNCQHTRAQHIDPDGDGCWAMTDKGSGTLCRCTEWVAMVPEFAKPKVDRNVAPIGGNHPATAVAAAARALPNSGTVRRTVYDLVRSRGPHGATTDEVQTSNILPDKHQSVSAAVSTLASDGLLIDSGQRRATRSGNPAIVWITAPAQEVEDGTLPL